jgi:transposase
MVTEIIRGRGKEPSGKKKAKPDYQAIADKNPIVYQSVEFLRDLHGFVDDASVGGMEAFIAKYTGCGIAPFERYARGIKADKDSVENAILNRDVNNGQMEGFNNKIKFLRKVRYGRSKGELLNAFSVLSTLPRFRYLDHLVPKLETMGNRRVKCYGMAA